MSRSKLHRLFAVSVSPGAACSLLLGAAAIAASPRAAAQASGTEAAPAFSGSLGTGAASLPTYEGSPNRRGALAASLSLRYRTQGAGSFELTQRGLAWQFHESGPLRLGLLGSGDPGRKTKNTSAADPTPGDERLAGLGDIRASPEAGAMLGWGPVNLAYRQSLGDRGHRGKQVDLTAEYPIPLTSRLAISLGAGATWADQRYMQAYFGVTPEQAAASAFGVFTPEAGVRKAELTVGAEYTLLPKWKLQTSLGVVGLLGDAKDSPLVDEQATSATGYVGVSYAF
jgi:outer membrane protein